MEARLLARLRHKLGDLEHRLQAYRRDLAADFERHCHDELRDVSPAIAAGVQRALAAALASYPALGPELEAAAAAAAAAADPRPAAAAFQPVPPPVSPPAAGAAVAVCAPVAAPAGSPRERERALEGLFTPTYLPLLDGSPACSSPALAAAAAGPAPADIGAALQAAGMEATGAQDGAQANAPDPPPQSAALSTLPGDGARSADDARSSVSSDKSDYKPPRSALRRSSSVSKHPQSPRRVRFEFMGAEVLPTTSPQPSEFMARRPPSPHPDGAAAADDDANDDDESVFTSNLGGDMGEEEQAPPRKVSSSDALRALSRAPLEEGVVWTVVNPDADDVATDEQDARVGALPLFAAPSQTTPASPKGQRLSPMANSEREPVGDDGGGDDSSDDGFLSMAKSRSSKNMPLQSTAPIKPAHRSATSAGQPNKQARNSSSAAGEGNRHFSSDDDGDAEDDELFHFEADGSSNSPRRIRRLRRRREPAASEEEGHGQEASPQPGSGDDQPGAPCADTAESHVSIYATSPAFPIRQASGSRPSTAPNVRFQPGSLGSYKGRPLMMPIVRDPDLLALANSAGSAKDRAAMEDGSPPRFHSTPLSFKERFMMEEMMEQAMPEQGEKEEEAREEAAKAVGRMWLMDD